LRLPTLHSFWHDGRVVKAKECIEIKIEEGAIVAARNPTRIAAPRTSTNSVVGESGLRA
jgi:hypothetical protein